MQESSRPDTKAPSTSLAGVLDRAWEWNWALRFAQIVIFFDLALISYSGNGLLKLSSTDTEVLSNFGFILVSMAIFALYASLIIPAINAFIPELIKESSRLSEFLYRINRVPSENRPSGAVSAAELRHHSLESNNEFLYNIYRESQERFDKKIALLMT